MKNRILNTKDILKNSFEMTYNSGVYLLLFELIYKGLILLVFKPILNIIVYLFIKARGYDVLVNDEISQFLFSFTGIFMIIIVMLLSLILIYYEFSVILLILDTGKKKEEIKLLDITEKALVKLKNVIKNKSIGLALYILVLIPILNIGIQSSLLPTLSIPNFMTGELAKYKGSGIIFFLIGLTLVYLFAKLFIVLPIMLFSNKPFKEAHKESFKTVKGTGFQIATVIIMGMIAWIGLTYLPFALLENAQFLLLRILRVISSISMAIFTLLISPFMLSISLATYNSYVEAGLLKRKKEHEKIKLGFFNKKLWEILSKVFELAQSLILLIKKHIKKSIALFLVAVIGINIYIGINLKSLYDEPLIIGHRGGEYGVENTIEAIMTAGVNGADYSEMDVLLTKDNVPVVIHDNNLKRLADVSKKISDLTADEVKEITIKSGDKEDEIPTLEELAIETKGRTKLLLEFKTHGEEKASVVDKTIEVLEEVGILEETIFQSSEKEIIEELNEKYQDLTIGYIFMGKIGMFSSMKMARMPVDFISAEESLINKSMVVEIHKANKPIFAWTINKDYIADELLGIGVDGIITDYPLEMLYLRDKYKDRE